MGGHGVPYKIPSPDIYKVEDVPQLIRVREKLAEKGLKDPWLRNEVWRFTAARVSKVERCRQIFRGAIVGIPAFLISLAVEQYLGTDDGHGHGHGHGDHH